jgi:hypothetical protein
MTMPTKLLLIVTALLEAGVGVALLAFPSATVLLLLAAPLEASAAVTLGRVAGAALLALGVANWLAQFDERSDAARGLVVAMVVYNLGAVAILGTAGILSQPVGIALWPGVAVHAAMAVWCVLCLLRTPWKKARQQDQ